MVSRGAFLLLLAACVGAYEKSKDFIQDFIQDSSSQANDTTSEALGLGDVIVRIPLRDLMLYRYINYMQNKSSNTQRLRYRPDYSAIKANWLRWPYTFSSSLSQANKEKRGIDNGSNKIVKIKAVIRKQPRWRIRRPPGLCLLKLCSPMYYTYE